MQRAEAAARAVELSSLTRELNAWIEVDLDRLAANVRALRREVGPEVELIAVVKANAYGHGVAGVAPALEQAGVDRFAVFSVAEGLGLRALGIARPVLVLGHTYPRDAEAAVAARLTVTVDEADLGRALDAAAARLGTRATVHVKVDTGLHRFGLPLEEAAQLAEWLRTLPNVSVEGLWTHMANADEPDDSFSEVQAERFEEAARRLPWIPYRHAANSATSLRRAGLRYHGIRVGITLFGLVPPNTPNPGLRPVLSLRARLARIADVAPGEGVSYGLTWRAGRPSRVGLVPVGYADGWMRALSNRGQVLLGGRRVPIVGRVCMDQFLVDVTEIPEASPGQEVTLLGRQEADEITADEVAEWAGTISWEILSRLGSRLPRIFHRDGRVEAVEGRV